MSSENPFQMVLANELKNMELLREQSNGILDFKVDPSRQHYTIYLKGVEALVGETTNNFSKQSDHVFEIVIPSEYPAQAPTVKFGKILFHPNWYYMGSKKGFVCWGDEWNPNKSLNEFVIDIVRMMQFVIVNPGSPANPNANEWYKQNKNRIYEYIKVIPFPPPIEDFVKNEIDDDIIINGIDESEDDNIIIHGLDGS